MSLPHHRKLRRQLRPKRHAPRWYQLVCWQLWWRDKRGAVKCRLLVGLAIAAAVYHGIAAYGEAHIASLDARHELLAMQYNEARMRHLGAPGFTMTDWQEGTANVEVREIPH